MNTIQSWFAAYGALMKEYPWLIAIMGMYGMTVFGFAFRAIPLRLYNTIKRQCSTTLIFTNNTVGTNLETFNNFMGWFNGNRWSKLSRSISLNGNYSHCETASSFIEGSHGTVVGAGDGSHFFIYKGRPCWMTRRQMESAASTYQINYEIRITMLGRSRKRILDMIEEFRYRPCPKKLGIFKIDKGGWTRITDIAKRPIETVVINRQVKSDILSTIDQFRGMRDWYEHRGLAYKKTFLFSGPPGTGKSSLIKALASHYQMNITLINLTAVSDEILESALATAPDNCIIVMEDFDSSDATQARQTLVRSETIRRYEEHASDEIPEGDGNVYGSSPEAIAGPTAPSGATNLKSSWLTLTGLLNALDGIVSLDGKLIFLTTNVVSDLDPALVRPGRIDKRFELVALEHAEVIEYLHLMFPEEKLWVDVYDQSLTFAPILGCRLQELYFEHFGSINQLVEQIPHTVNRPPTLPRVEPGALTHSIHSIE